MSDTPVCQCRCGGIACASRSGRQGKRAGLTVHGTTAGYMAGCRCDDCTISNTRRSLTQRANLNKRTRPGAVKWGQEWTSAELEVATRPGFTAREAGVLLGRTMQAVKDARHKCRHDPKFIALLGSPQRDFDSTD